MSKIPVLAALLLACGCADQPETESTSAPLTLQTNYAIGKPTTQSSTDFGGVSSRAVDGNTSGVWSNNSVTHTAYGYQPWWQVDLVQGRYIDVIDIWGRTDCCASRLSTYYVFVSNDPFPSTDLYQTLANPNVKAFLIPGVSQLPVQEVAVHAVGRYVRIQLTASDYLSLAEVQVKDRVNVITGPDRIATATTWQPTGTVTSSTGFALAEVGDSLRAYQRGGDGLLTEAIDLGVPHDVPGSDPITSDAVRAVTDASSAHTYVTVRTTSGFVEVADLYGGGWTWSVPGLTDGPPAVAVACGKVYVAARLGTQLQVWSLPVGATSGWQLAMTYFNVRTPPTLYAAPGGDLGIGFITADNWIRFARASCAAGGVPGGAGTPWGTSFSSTPIGLYAYGDLFAVAVQGTDNLPYFAMQRHDANGVPTWVGFEAVQQPQTIIEAPTIAMYRGLMFLAARDTTNALRYWVRAPNALSSQVWASGRVVGDTGIGAVPPAFATRGTRSLWDNYGRSETADGELYVATKGIGDQQEYALNFGRFASMNILTGIYGIYLQTGYEANNVDPRVIPQLPDNLVAFLTVPAKYWWYTAHPYGCDHTLTILLETNFQNNGWTKQWCGTFTADPPDNRSYPVPAILLDSVNFPAWSIWEELGHHLQTAVPGFKSQAGYSPTFTTLVPPLCNTDADCNGNHCGVGSWGFENTPTCQAHGYAHGYYRPVGFVDWYDVTQDEHSFINFVEWYRWWGDELRSLRDDDLAHGNTLLRDKYNWVKANFYDGVEFNGWHAALQTGGSRNNGGYGMPLN